MADNDKNEVETKNCSEDIDKNVDFDDKIEDCGVEEFLCGEHCPEGEVSRVFLGQEFFYFRVSFLIGYE